MRRQIALPAATLVAAGLAFTLSASPFAQRVEKEGIAIEVTLESRAPDGVLREGEPAVLRFGIRDTTSGTPLSSLFPAAWMDLRPRGEGASDGGACQQKVEAFIGGSLLSPPELNFNTYFVLALNEDASISVVDPLFGFGTTKLLAMILLRSPGVDWALTENTERLFVAMPEVDQIAVAETTLWKVVTNLDTGPRPTRAVLQPDGQFLWVGYEQPFPGSEQSGVTVISAAGLSVLEHIPTGRGYHDIAFSPQGRHAFVTNAADATVSIVDIWERRKIKDMPVGREPVSIAYSRTSDAAYVASRDGSITVIDGKTLERRATVKAEKPGLRYLAFAPGERFAFVVDPEHDLLHILDAARDRVVQTGTMEKGPDQVDFSDELAYVRHRGSATVLMIPLDQIGGDGEPIPVVDFPGGQRPVGAEEGYTPAAGIVQAPGATAVLVANPADRSIYYYKEGMAAPMGHFQNYGRSPRAVAVVDRSLQERKPGVYETVAQLRRPGMYDLAFFLDSPRTVACFEVEVHENPRLVAERRRTLPVRVEPLAVPEDPVAGETVPVRFRLVDSVSGSAEAGLEDVHILTFRTPGRDRLKQRARHVGEGIYEVEVPLRASGVYYAVVECPSQNLDTGRSPYVTFAVSEKTPTSLP